MPRKIRVLDLPQSPAFGVHLHCDACGEQFSAHRGDYFLQHPEYTFRHCGRYMRLASIVTTYPDAVSDLAPIDPRD